MPFEKLTEKVHEFRFKGKRLEGLVFRYRRPTARQFMAFKDSMFRVADVKSGTVTVATKYEQNQAALSLASDCLVGWDGYIGEDKQPVPFSRDEAMAFDPQVMVQFLRHIDEILAISEDERGN